MSFTSSSMLVNSEINSLEAISLYVENYKSLKKVHINLNSKYDTHYDKHGVLHISDSKQYESKEKFSNAKVLCGENGTGKTSVLELLRNPKKSPNNILVMKTSSNKFISSNKVTINYNNNIYDCNTRDIELKFGELSVAQSTLYEDGLHIKRFFLHFYLQEKELFNEIDSQLITHFELAHWESNDTIPFMAQSIRNKLPISHISEFDLERLRDADLLTYLFYQNFGDSSFDDWIRLRENELLKILKKSGMHNTTETLISIRKIFFDPKKSSKVHKVINAIKSMIKKEYTITEYPNVENKLSRLANEFDILMDSPHKEANVHQWKGVINSLFYLRGYKKFKKNKRYLENLSSGEYFSIRNTYHLYAKMLQNDSAFILEDEPELHLHPEWARLYVNNYFEAVRRIRKHLGKTKDKKYETKTYNFIFTTHSPIILSDFFNREVVFFQRSNQRVSIAEHTANCFAGNIGDLLFNNFFLSKTIGEYSENKINEAITTMDEAKQGMRVTAKEKKRIQTLISCIGDRLLKKLLEDKFSRSFK